MNLEQRLVRAQTPLQAGGRSSAHDLGVDAELLREFLLPLLAQVGRAYDCEPLDLSAIEEFPGDQPGLDGLADADIVGDEQPHRVELQRHEQRHELIGARFDIEVAEAPERPGAGA